MLSDVLTVKLGWGAGAPRELWKLEERVVLGESTQRKRAVWGLMEGWRSVPEGECWVVHADKGGAGGGGGEHEAVEGEDRWVNSSQGESVLSISSLGSPTR